MVIDDAQQWQSPACFCISHIYLDICGVCLPVFSNLRARLYYSVTVRAQIGIYWTGKRAGWWCVYEYLFAKD